MATLTNQTFIDNTLFRFYSERELRVAAAPGGDVDESKRKQDKIFDAEITAAKQWAYSFCRGRYTVPFATLPVELEEPVAIKVIENILCAAGSVPERITEKLKDAIKYMEDISSGRVALNVATPTGDVTGKPWTSKATDELEDLRESMNWW